MSEVTYYAKVFIVIIVLVNPMEGIPLFLSRTGDLSQQQKYQLQENLIAAFIILITALFLRRYLLEIFGIGILPFTLAGGVIIFLVSLDMVLGKSNTSDKDIPKDPTQNPSDIAVVPLAMPLF